MISIWEVVGGNLLAAVLESHWRGIIIIFTVHQGQDIVVIEV
jgi:hypothetical protein